MNVVSIEPAQARRVAYSRRALAGGRDRRRRARQLRDRGPPRCVSALIGGGISTLASLVMAAARVSGRSAMANAHSAVRAFYVGEAAKLATVVVLFVVVLRTMKVAPLAMFAAYVATFFVYWVALANALPTLGGSASWTAVPHGIDVQGDIWNDHGC